MKEEEAVRKLLTDRPDLQFFYIISLNYLAGSIGYSAFHSLATDQQECQATIQRICAEQKAECEREIAELKQLPEDEQPYDPALPDGCSVGLYVVLPDKKHYVLMQGQSWHNQGQTFHSPLIPDIFDVAYYIEKAKQGDYRRYLVKS